METIINFILHTDIYLASLIQTYGAFVYVLLFLIIFMETGLVFTPFLPGDSLLFVAGTFAGVGSLNVYFLFFILSVAAILGDTVNYWIGHFLGEKIISKFIKQEYLEKTNLFFNKHGKKTIMLARFVPTVRTFAPFVAGVGKMNYISFLNYNIFGGIFWVASFVFSGFFLGNVSYIKNNLSVVVLLIIIFSFSPAIWEYIKHKKKK